MQSLDELIDDFLKDLYEQQPVLATHMGIDGYEDRLGDFSDEGFKGRHDAARKWLSRFESVPDEGLSLDEQIDRDLVVSTLRGEIISEEDWRRHEREPGQYLSAVLYGAFLPFLYRLYPEKEIVSSVSARLEKAGEVLGHAQKNLDPKLASKLVVERGLEQCMAGIHYFRNLIPAEVEDPSLRDEITAAGENAASEFERFAEFLQKLGADAQGDWALGEERYSALLLQKEMLGYGAIEMLERGQQALEELQAEMAAHAKKMTGSDDWMALRDKLEKEGFDTPDEVRDEYEKWTEQARQFLIDKDLVTLPEGEECIVMPSPEFQRPIIAVASYSQPPPFRPSLVGRFFVPYPPTGTPPDDVRKRARASGKYGIATTSVHEAYPGHHWHLVWMQQNPRVVRKVVRTSYFVEGWALHAERLMREQGFFTDPRYEFAHIGARLFRAARIVVDTSLHTGRMTPDEAIEFLTVNVAGKGKEPVLKTEVGRYCSWPTQAPSYLTGALEIERMRDRYFAEKRGTVKEFNEAIAGSGGLPIGLAERALFGS